MGLESVRCFKCQNYGHLAQNCDEETYAAEIGGGDKPPWCGECDRETRLVYFRRDGQEAARRCTTCHPSGHLLPAEFKRCNSCRSVIYEWDMRSECGSHQPVGKQLQVNVVRENERWRARGAPERKTA